jgi:hypothetical protein
MGSNGDVLDLPDLKQVDMKGQKVIMEVFQGTPMVVLAEMNITPARTPMGGPPKRL